MDVKRGVIVPFGTQSQCEWGRQQVGVATGLRGGQSVGWGVTPCWSDGR